MATSTVGMSESPHCIGYSGPLSESIKTFAFSSILILSFVPVLIYINLSQVFLLLLCALGLCFYLVRIEIDILAVFILMFSISLFQAAGIAHSPATDKNYLTPFLFLTSLLIGPTVMLLARSLPRERLIQLVSRLINGIFVFLVVECVSRFIFSPYLPATAETDVTDNFYLYKASLFFFDSNFVGIEILCFLAIMFAFRKSVGPRQWLLAYLLLLATLSRASIAAGLCQLVIYKLWRWRKWTLVSLLVAQTAIIARLFINFTMEGSDAIHNVDGSLASKFFILTLMTDIYKRADTAQRLFGIGVGNLFNLAGIFAHNIVATFVLELGIGGSLLFAAYVWFLSRKCPASIYLLTLPIIINGFSLVSTTMPYFFATLGLLAALRDTQSDYSGIPEIKITSRSIEKGKSWQKSTS